jgi:hypothetical protein
MAPQVMAHPEARTQEASPVTNRSVLAGDPIAYAGSKLEGVEHDHPHACYQGVVYIGHVVEDPGTGEEVEVIEAVPCRRCVTQAVTRLPP